jgi:uncharacterized protein
MRIIKLSFIALGVYMFPEYRDLISKLKQSDLHFAHLFNQHNEIDQKIKNIEALIEVSTDEEIENLKKEKLHLKDELYRILVKAHQS